MNAPNSQFPISHSRFPIPDSRFPIPDSLLKVLLLRSMSPITGSTSAPEPCMKLSPHTAPEYLFDSSESVGDNFG
ncbi:hypothetical protein, partial [Moorena sp. SIO4G3]|uniref:hypothetical protein n=1 Tax=Moorena sp. SIO4G3 TaxID=2607821 RepID=UPI00142A950C